MLNVNHVDSVKINFLKKRYLLTTYFLSTFIPHFFFQRHVTQREYKKTNRALLRSALTEYFFQILNEYLYLDYYFLLKKEQFKVKNIGQNPEITKAMVLISGKEDFLLSKLQSHFDHRIFLGSKNLEKVQ